MQSRALCRLLGPSRSVLHRPGQFAPPWPPAGTLLGAALRVRHSSFIKEVMDQVKRDMEQDEKLKKDWDRVQKTTERIKEHGAQQEERFRTFEGSMRSASERTAEALGRFKDRARESSNRFSQVTEENESMRRAAEAARKGFEAGAASSRTVLQGSKGVFDRIMESTKKATAMFETDKAEKHKKWKEARDTMAAAAAAKEAEAAEAGKDMEQPAEASGDGQGAKAEGASQASASAPPPDDHALVVSDRGQSTWDRFGAGLRDSPFLNNLYENPLFAAMLGESEIAAAIREMKEMDYTFQLEDFAEEIEYVVAPHVVQCYLEGDSESLEKHCGEAAFNAVNASIKARRKQKLSLDTGILSGPKEVELKGAQCMDQGAPCFIWTFNTQQINCLRDSQGEIVEGAVDDIRTVYYAMVVTRHPNLDELSLEYPWQISELAIVGNQPTW
mmetsp:Transcript_64865/g.154882  ORF Transcript_64865/g.154882 Transcript_64865/m.154882 type:complete len:444 (+) Transcript_64865:90-1421(+)